VMDGVGLGTAGEFGSCILWTLTAECAEAVLDPEESEEKPLGSYRNPVREAVRAGLRSRGVGDQ
jgi:hypothetical protein